MLECIRTFVSRVATLVEFRDWVAFAGLGLLAVGIGVVYWPAAVIVIGGLLITLSVWGERHGNPR